MIATRVFTFFALFLSVGSACTTKAWDRDGAEICVDPCMNGQFFYDGNGVPKCPLDGQGRVCPRESVAFLPTLEPICVIRRGPNGFACPAKSIRYDVNQIPGCFDMCGTIAWYMGSPLCLDCPPEKVAYNNAQEPKCFNCVSISYFNGDPVCMDCTADKVRYNANQEPGCYDCQSIGWFNGNPICLNCGYDKVKYNADQYPYCS